MASSARSTESVISDRQSPALPIWRPDPGGDKALWRRALWWTHNYGDFWAVSMRTQTQVKEQDTVYSNVIRYIKSTATHSFSSQTDGTSRKAAENATDVIQHQLLSSRIHVQQGRRIDSDNPDDTFVLHRQCIHLPEGW